MTEQIPLEFGADARAREAWAAVLRRIREGMEATGGIKEWAYKLDVAPTLLSDALHERDRKNFQARWLAAVIVLMPEPHRKALLDELAGAGGYELQPRRVLTTAEKLARLEEAVRTRLGPLGDELLRAIDR